MMMSPEKYVLLRAKVLDMNSKSLEVDGAEHRVSVVHLQMNETAERICFPGKHFYLDTDILRCLRWLERLDQQVYGTQIKSL